MKASRQAVVFLSVFTVFAATLFADSNQTLNMMIRRYSEQQIFFLDLGEEYSFALKNGSQKVIRLISVSEHRDTVIGLMRRAEVDVEINGKPLRLICAPYVMPTEIEGLRIQADTTSGWLPMPKKAQFSVWDATDPIVKTDSFCFPIRDYVLFSHGMQAYNEVVHLGQGDGDPEGQRFYHDYGVDIAGYEAHEEIISCCEGEVISISPSRENVCSVLIQDSNGFIWEYGHLDSVFADIGEGTLVRKSQKLGMLGKTGPSGNFSHLHLGTYLSKTDFHANRANRNLNLYPWVVAAYQEHCDRNLYAVARPHHAVLTGEKVLFDASNSMALENDIVSYRWVFHDGETVNQVEAQKVFEKPGVYIAELWVKDEKGIEDVDFCRVKVFTKSGPEGSIPTIFTTYTPTSQIRVNQPVLFRFWLQEGSGEAIAIDFGDGTVIDKYVSYSELRHSFKTKGIHIVSAYATIAGKPITQKLKLIVHANEDQKLGQPYEPNK